MTDRLVENIRRENYLLEIFSVTKDSKYVSVAKNIIEFVKDIYRNIEPSHYSGKIGVFYDFSEELSFLPYSEENFYDKGMLNNNFSSIVFQINNSDGVSPSIWTNIDETDLTNLLKTEKKFISYVFNGDKEYFIVNNQEIPILNKFSCASIFALQYHYLNEALSDFKNDRIRTVSCEHFNKCWDDENWIYLKNKSEDCMQVSLAEFIKSRVRGINVNREYNLNARKPVDVRVFWREANRSALIEMKWMGQSLNKSGDIGTPYSNGRANKGMKQIKEYIDLDRGDSPSVITKGFLVVIDGRRKNINSNKVETISRKNGMYYANKELEISKNKQYWNTYLNIEAPIRMFVEPICEM